MNPEPAQAGPSRPVTEAEAPRGKQLSKINREEQVEDQETSITPLAVGPANFVDLGTSMVMGSLNPHSPCF